MAQSAEIDEIAHQIHPDGDGFRDSTGVEEEGIPLEELQEAKEVLEKVNVGT